MSAEEKKCVPDNLKPVFASKEALQKHRALVEDLATRRFFYIPAFEIYGGQAGLYDYGPQGCTIRDNILQFWRQHFIYTESMQEVSCVSVTPAPVLKTSGHVDRFTDYLVKDAKNDTICLRADKLIEEHVDKLLEDASLTAEKRAELLRIRTTAGAMNKDEISRTIKQLKVKSPDTGNELTEPYAFNLMFETSIGPSGKVTGYLRPETAQGIFVNFKRLFDCNQSKMPFAAAQIGTAYRNEIAPRSGLIRVREFTLAEIEHFVNPEDKRHAKFQDVEKILMFLLPRERQTGEDIAVRMTAGEAVKKGTINNETLAYFMVRTQLFLLACGIQPDMLRFRQHKSTEMAHYAKDCWDAEVLTTYGWVECVGHADRAAFDLSAHALATKVDMSVFQPYDKPRQEKIFKAKLNFKSVGKKDFKKEMKTLAALLDGLSPDEVALLKKELADTGVKVFTVNGAACKLGNEDIVIVDEVKSVAGYRYTPSVIEPSFGIGRILYAILEQTFTKRDEKDDKRVFLKLPSIVAPYKVAVLPLSMDDQIMGHVHTLVSGFAARNVSARTDIGTAQLGRKYARIDEIGVPFAVTVDFESVKDGQVTIRERDSMKQIRVPMETAWDIINQITLQQTRWEDAYAKYPHVERKEDDQ